MPLSETIIPGLPRIADERHELARNPFARDRGVGDRRQTFARDVIDDVEDTEPPAKGELIVDEVERPARIDLGFDEDRYACSNGSAPSLALADCKPFLPIETVDAVDT